MQQRLRSDQDMRDVSVSGVSGRCAGAGIFGARRYGRRESISDSRVTEWEDRVFVGEEKVQEHKS